MISTRKASNTMEKKVPERKVNLREEDIIYIYDKRINRCINDGCAGTVKYGLVLRVSVSEGETLNCFECNKCHMKYTPYPNYVRLTKTDMLHIQNKEEVEARDKKRAEDALKQAAREKKSRESNGFGKKPFERKPYDKKPYERKSYDKKPYDKKPFERKPFDKNNFDKNSEGSFNKSSYEKNSYDKNSFERKPYERKSYEKKNYGYEGRYDRKPYSGNSYSSDRPNYQNKYSGLANTNGGYRKPFTSDKSFDKRNDSRYNNRGNGVFIVSGGYKKNFNDKSKKSDSEE